MIFLYILLAALLLVLATSLICFLKVFYTSRREKWPEYPVPAGEIYAPHHEKMIEWIKLARALPHKEVSIRSFDGLRLCGNYYEFEKGAPIDILFHGYHGSSEQDLSGGVYRCQRLGHNVLIVDHRAAGKSEGHVITFGVNESRDAAAWVQYVVENIDPNAKILLGGISMGAATVMMTMICVNTHLINAREAEIARLEASNASARARLTQIREDIEYYSSEEVIRQWAEENGLVQK